MDLTGRAQVKVLLLVNLGRMLGMGAGCGSVELVAAHHSDCAFA